MIIESMAASVAVVAFVAAIKGLNKFNPNNINVMRGLPVTKPDYKALRINADKEFSKGFDHSTSTKRMFFGK